MSVSSPALARYPTCWTEMPVGDWFFHDQDTVRIVSGPFRGELAVVRGHPSGPTVCVDLCVVREGVDPSITVPREALVPELDFSNIGTPVFSWNDPSTDTWGPCVWTLTAFDPLRPNGHFNRHGSPMLRRLHRVWGWFPHFAEALWAVQTNQSDLHEASYQYLLIEEVPSGISAYHRKEWWWRWNHDKDGWIASEKPADLERKIALSIG